MVIFIHRKLCMYALDKSTFLRQHLIKGKGLYCLDDIVDHLLYNTMWNYSSSQPTFLFIFGVCSKDTQVCLLFSDKVAIQRVAGICFFF